MPRKVTDKGTVLINVRLTPQQVERIDQMVDRGAAISRSDFVKDAINIKLYVEETREAKLTVKPQP